MEAFITSTLLVAVAEIGDKTQLLSFVLAAKLRQPVAIVMGILVATLANHLLAASLGVWIAYWLSGDALLWIVGLTFIAFGLWALKPDTLDGDPRIYKAGAFVTTVIVFFIAEMGDKTQFATIALSARFEVLLPVVIGTTLGMMAANIPAVWIGETLAHRIPMKTVRWLAAGLFIVIGGLTLMQPIGKLL